MSDVQQPSAESGWNLRALIAKNPTVWLVSALAVVFLLLATAALSLGLASSSAPTAVVVTPTSTSTAKPGRVQPAGLSPASRLRTCSVSGAAADPDLGNLAASVISATTGELLFDRSGASPQSPAGVLQLLTAATAIATLGPGATLSTKVMDGTAPGSIVLVGGGDATLSTTSNSVYDDAPLLSDLATAAMEKYTIAHPDVPITSVILDASLWDPADNWDPSWPVSERTEGYQPFVTALMVDGDRADPTRLISPRGDDPVTRAGEAFVAAAGLTDVVLSNGTANGSTVLAEVSSQPVATLVSQMLMTSDNALAEMLVRASSLKKGLGGSSSSVQEVVRGTLAGLGMTGTDVLVIKDGSGVSANNAVPPAFVAQLMVKVRAGDAGLGAVHDGLPVGGDSGDLSDRFTGDNATAGAATLAKSGWIYHERSLAGTVTASDGIALTFAFYGLGDAISFDTREALDSLVAAVYDCGNNLSNN
ncbi:D-alanyl-D-alanine carboxypeptidase [Salinibacterium sp. G-O1]|uniref:D-alanyl-D-alanine carboxypeptidase/D-alanyl-D-alanine-endopeptidase n=1 Tax=Salinibacterium sp. G-O1 TaxID=3046208 RepID=UPI0024BAB336|nr:D-alanyl-D-alanine carboxypeptidase [Salinibacterium sp. G-O1]MDJ0334278.1 D-alanyl-D-alanine carboxypeptidase [Salinibacterium sp. G-O1]